MEVEIKTVDYWNDVCKKKGNSDVLPVGREEKDYCFSCGRYLFLLQGVQELNNLCIVKERGGEVEDVIEVMRLVFRYLYDNGVVCVAILSGSGHKSYDVLYRYFNAENIVKSNGLYFVYLTESKEWEYE